MMKSIHPDHKTSMIYFPSLNFFTLLYLQNEASNLVFVDFIVGQRLKSAKDFREIKVGFKKKILGYQKKWLLKQQIKGKRGKGCIS